MFFLILSEFILNLIISNLFHALHFPSSLLMRINFLFRFRIKLLIPSDPILDYFKYLF